MPEFGTTEDLVAFLPVPDAEGLGAALAGIPGVGGVSRSQVFAAEFTPGQNMNAGGTSATIGDPVRVDSGWSETAGTFDFAGTAKVVRIKVHAYGGDPSDIAAKQRVSPEMVLFKNGTAIRVAATGYQRHNSGTSTSSVAIIFDDFAPGNNPTYRLEWAQGSTQDGTVPLISGGLSLEAESTNLEERAL